MVILFRTQHTTTTSAKKSATNYHIQTVAEHTTSTKTLIYYSNHQLYYKYYVGCNRRATYTKYIKATIFAHQEQYNDKKISNFWFACVTENSMSGKLGYLGNSKFWTFPYDQHVPRLDTDLSNTLKISVVDN